VVVRIRRGEGLYPRRHRALVKTQSVIHAPCAAERSGLSIRS
jgi:hypothetical protein